MKALVDQWIDHQTSDLGVAGSSPVGGLTFWFCPRIPLLYKNMDGGPTIDGIPTEREERAERTLYYTNIITV